MELTLKWQSMTESDIGEFIEAFENSKIEFSNNQVSVRNTDISYYCQFIRECT